MMMATTDELLEMLDDTSWQSTRPGGFLPERYCMSDQPIEYQDQHEPHDYWLPQLVRTRVYGPQVQRTLETTWYHCLGSPR